MLKYSSATVFMRVWDEQRRIFMVLNHSKKILNKLTGAIIGMKLIGWGLPGGGVKDGEDPLQAGLRELREETPISRPRKIVERPVRVIFKNKEGHVIFIFDAFEPISINSNWRPTDDPQSGVIDGRWFTVEEAEEEEFGRYPIYKSHRNYLSQREG